MAAPSIAKPESIPVAQEAESQTDSLKPTSLKQRIEVWLREIFEGHEEFLGWTPD